MRYFSVSTLCSAPQLSFYLVLFSFGTSRYVKSIVSRYVVTRHNIVVLCCVVLCCVVLCCVVLCCVVLCCVVLFKQREELSSFERYNMAARWSFKNPNG